MTSTTTPTTWVTIDEAAALLGISGRQVQRRVAAGQMQAQRRADGRTLVAVPASDTASGVALQLHEQADAARRLADLVEQATGLAVRQAEARLADQVLEVGRWRRTAWAGWATAMVAVAGLAATVSWGVMASVARADDRDRLADLHTAETRRIEAIEGLIDALATTGSSDIGTAQTIDCPTEMSEHATIARGG